MTKNKPKTLEIDPAEEKQVIFWPDRLRDEIKKDWPEAMRKEGGFQLSRVQQGLDPDNYRPMTTIAPGVREIKLQDEDKSQYRLLYTANFEDVIYVFHVITKKTTEQTTTQDIQLAKKRHSEIVAHRQKSKKR